MAQKESQNLKALSQDTTERLKITRANAFRSRKAKSEKDRPITKITIVHFAFAAPKYIDTNDLLC